MTWTLPEVLQIMAPAVAVYVAIRVDMAAYKIRLDHLERDLYEKDKRP